MENRVNEHEFDDIAQILEEERQSQLPRYASLIESVFGEQERISKERLEQVRKMQEGGSYE